MRRLVVNAHVTPMITICESIGQFLVLITIILEMEIGLLLFCGLHFNVLPILFLMNTRENKGSVVQLGWINVLRQCCRSISFPYLGQNKVLPFRHVKYNAKNDICTISQTVHKEASASNKNQQPKEFILTCDPNTPIDENASTSKCCNETNNYYRKPTESSTSSISPPCHKRKLTSKELINELLYNIYDEKTYISLFIQLTDLEEKSCNEDEIDNVEIPNNEVVIDIVQKLMINGTFQYRVSVREEILKKLINCYNEQSVYNELLEKLMRTEENFLINEY